MVKVNTKKILNGAKEFDAIEGAFVYFLLKEGVIVYVGQSKSLGARISTHKKGKDFDSVKYLKVPKADQNSLEMALIKSIRPTYNTQPLGPMTDGEIKILRTYEFEEQTIAQILRSQAIPERHAYGYVGYFDDEGNPQVGYYDDEDEFEEHDEECRMGKVEDIIGVTDGLLQECLLDFCDCEPEAIVMVEFLTYKNMRRDNLRVVDAPEFEPFREKFDKAFFDGREKLVNKRGEDGSEENSRRNSIYDS